MKNWCRVCGKEYPVCHVCANVRNYTPWRIICDTNEHYRIWLVVEQYRKGIMALENAREQLIDLGCNMNNIVDYIPAVREIIIEIMNNEICEANGKLGQNDTEINYEANDGEGLWPKPQVDTRTNKRKKARS